MQEDGEEDRNPNVLSVQKNFLEGKDEGSQVKILWKTIKERDLHLSYGKLYPPRGKEARRLFAALENEVDYLPTETTKIRIFGKWHPIPRKQAGYGDPGISYTYSGISLSAKVWTPVLKELVLKVKQATGHDYNFVLINRYADGKDSMGEHKDDEKELDPHVPIASMRLGAQRDFYFKHQRTRNQKDKSIPKVSLQLEDGSLLLMNEPTNKFWYHALPVRKSCHNIRINLTFRKIKL